MASAILTSRNDTRSGDYISRFTDNANLNFMRLQNIPNPNPNPNSSHFFVGNSRRDVIWNNHQQLPSFVPPQANFIGSLINAVPANSYNYRYVTFRLDSYTRRELKELRKRLIMELKRVRALRQWICSTRMTEMSYRPPQLQLPAAPKAFVTGKQLQKSGAGQKRTNPLPPVRYMKKQCGRVTIAQRRKMMVKECGQILSKLMMHKHGWVFNTPVDAVAMKLYDYHKIISKPMDLGTIKSKLAKNEYDSPLAFASDVRLTFQNAMLYNGRGSNVFVMAERLLILFEEMFGSSNQKFVVNQAKKQNRSAIVPISVDTPVVPQSNAANFVAPTARVSVSKKPEMTEEEKSKLAASFWNLQLGPEGVDQIMAIVKKGVAGLQHQGNEIELDLAVLDNDTLWGLHSFVSKLIPSFAGSDNEHLVEEDVDIGDEMQLAIIPTIEIEKDGVNVSSSEASSGSDSSSSDSGSGACSEHSYNEQEVNSTPKVVFP